MSEDVGAVLGGAGGDGYDAGRCPLSAFGIEPPEVVGGPPARRYTGVAGQTAGVANRFSGAPADPKVSPPGLP